MSAAPSLSLLLLPTEAGFVIGREKLEEYTTLANDCAAHRRLACAAVNNERLGARSPLAFLTNDVLRLVSPRYS